MSRLTLTDGTIEIFMKMSDGNPGAMTCLVELLKKKDWYANIPGVMMILMLDSIGVYGEKLYMLWNDCCDRDLIKMELVIRNYQMGKLSTATILEHVAPVRGLPFENLIPLEELFNTIRFDI